MILPEQYNQFLKSVANDLEGDWLVIGGSLLAIIQSDSRSTVDIDLCPINEMTNELRLSLMTVAQKSGLAIESINPAAANSSISSPPRPKIKGSPPFKRQTRLPSCAKRTSSWLISS